LSIPALYLVAQQFAGMGLLSDMPDGFAKYALSFVLLDLAMYGWHYLTHHFDWLWRFHRVHHSDLTLNVTTGLRFHLAELLMEALVRVLFIAVIGVDPGVVLFTQTLITLFVLFHHTNITFPNEREWSWVFIVPRLHRVHHSALREEHDSNYGAVFSLGPAVQHAQGSGTDGHRLGGCRDHLRPRHPEARLQLQVLPD
jgi:sterol desaturase/sphingolipid hydroxylase (fatty acid hydroxylase superfamily)